MLTHANVVSTRTRRLHHLRMTPADAGLCALPLFHCFGQNFIMNALVAAGGTMVLQERFVPADFLTAIARHRVTILYAVPTMYILLLAGDLAAHDLSSLRLSFSAAAMLPARGRGALDCGDRAALDVPGYGLTESSPFATYNHEHSPGPDRWARRSENVGGAGGGRAGPRGARRHTRRDRDPWPQRDAEATWRSRGHRVDPARRWLHSGDIGRRDEDGYFYVVDRVKDMVNVAGFKVFPGGRGGALRAPGGGRGRGAGPARPDQGRGRPRVRGPAGRALGLGGRPHRPVPGRLASYEVPVVVEFPTASQEPDREDPQEEPEVGAGRAAPRPGRAAPQARLPIVSPCYAFK